MKLRLFPLLLLLLLISCQGRKVSDNHREISSLKEGYSEIELSIDDCLAEKSREYSCSLDDYACQEENLSSCGETFYNRDEKKSIKENVQNLKKRKINLSNYSWLFLNPFKIAKTVKFIRNIRDTAKELRSLAKKNLKQGLHGQGVALRAAAYIAEGRELTLEAMIFNNEISLFCAPGMSYISDIGVEVGVARAVALGCKEKSDYQGQFVSLAAGVSFTNFLLPFGVDLAYSFGFDTSVFKESIQKSQINYDELKKELVFLVQSLDQYFYNHSLEQREKKSLLLGLQVALKSIGVSEVVLEQEIKKSVLGLGAFDRQNSLGKILKKILTSDSFTELLDQYELTNSIKLFTSLEKSFSGCDAVSSIISLNLSASPVSTSVASTMFTNLFSMDLERVFSLKSISSFMLMNPILMDPYTLSKVVEVATLIDNFPEVLANQCYDSRYDNMIKELSVVDSFISE